MDRAETDAIDADMMRRCLALSKSSSGQGEYPYAAVICRNGKFVCESINRVAHDNDVMRHAEVIALSEAQKLLGRTSLDDCTLYGVAEPCAYCSYAIRETRIGRVVYGLRSPVMGGHSRWNILADSGLSDTMPEVFADVPEIVAGSMSHEAADIFANWNPLFWRFIKSRGLFVAGPVAVYAPGGTRRNKVWRWTVNAFRRNVIDRIGRR
jgi:tRNA(adenine34) deaminase